LLVNVDHYRTDIIKLPHSKLQQSRWGDSLLSLTHYARTIEVTYSRMLSGFSAFDREQQSVA